MTFRLALDDTVNSYADIRMYLVDRFHDIRTTHILHDRIPKSWPTEENIETLVEKSSGQFIYAATVIRYVSSSRHNPMNRLQVINGILPVNNDKPYAQLDALYINILSGVENIEAVLKILGVHLVISVSTRNLAITELETFMLLSAGDIQLLLIDLVSVVDASDEQQPIRFLHASFNDFLYEQTRSLEFFIDSTQMHAEAARLCLWHINKFWKSGFNILGLSNYPLDNKTQALIFHLECGEMQSQGLRQEILDGHYLECLPYIQRYSRAGTDFVKSDGTDVVYFLDFLHFSYFTDNENLYLHQRSVWDCMLLKALTTLRGSRELAFWTALYLAPKFRSFSRFDLEAIKALSPPGDAPYPSYTPFILIHALGQGIEDVVDPTRPWVGIGEDYRALLVDFFADPSRAGLYTLGEPTYTTATEFLLAFAVRPWDQEKKRLYNKSLLWVILCFVWNIFPTFLSQAGHSDELIRVLGCETLTFGLLYPEDKVVHVVLRAVANYLNKYTECVPTGFQIAVEEWRLGVNGGAGNISNRVYYLDTSST